MTNKFNIRTVLVAPLDWGLGHTTRCIPLIDTLLKANLHVIVAGNATQRKLLQQEFPSISFLELPGYNVRYSKKKWLLPITLLLQMPKIVRSIRHENNWLQKIVESYAIDLVISDNRYGLFTSKAPCIFITHQLTIKAPFRFIESRLQHISYSYINRYNACWVPDVAEEENIAGELSHPKQMPHVPVHYMGLLTRFVPKATEKKYDYCIVLSGPEPQRTILETLIIKDISSVSGKVLLVRGKPNETNTFYFNNNVEVKNHLNGNELQEAFLQSEYIVSRSGYTTVMELLSLQKKSILIPTPGQTEQEYLAERLMKQGWCFCMEQSSFNFKKAISEANQFAYSSITTKMFDEARLKSLLEML